MCIRDRTIPGMMVVNPSDGVSAEILMRQIIDHEGPCYVRLGRAAVPNFYQPGDYIKLGKGNCCLLYTSLLYKPEDALSEKGFKNTEAFREYIRDDEQAQEALFRGILSKRGKWVTVSNPCLLLYCICRGISFESEEELIDIILSLIHI